MSFFLNLDCLVKSSTGSFKIEKNWVFCVSSIVAPESLDETGHVRVCAAPFSELCFITTLILPADGDDNDDNDDDDDDDDGGMRLPGTTMFLESSVGTRPILLATEWWLFYNPKYCATSMWVPLPVEREPLPANRRNDPPHAANPSWNEPLHLYIC